MHKILNHCIGFRKKDISHMIIASVYYILTLVLSILTEDTMLFFIVFFWSAPACAIAIYESITARTARKLLTIPFCFILIILSIFPVAFLIFLFGIFVFRWAKNHKSKSCEEEVNAMLSLTDNKKVANLQFSYSDIYTVNITGVMHEHDGIASQTTIPTLTEDDEIVLEWDSNNKYDSTAIKVKTINGIHIGWIPKDDEVKEQMLNAWKTGGTVIAWVRETYELKSYPGNIGLCIGISIIDNTIKKERLYNDISNYSSFPNIDCRGKKALTLREADIYGVGKIFRGVPAQDIISRLNIGDDVFFEISKTSDAVKVLTADGKQFGYLPERKDLNEPKVKCEVYDRLSRGATVLAKVKKKYTNENNKIGVIITICRYAA